MYVPRDRTVLANAIRDQDNKCYLCTHPFDVNARPTRDHVLPQARFPNQDGTKNIKAAHQKCNHAKRDMTADEFRYFLLTGRLAPSYVAWIEKNIRDQVKRAMGIEAGDTWRQLDTALRGRAVEANILSIGSSVTVE